MSGGLDSTVLLFDIHRQNFKIHCLLFNYGQTHIKELDYARKHCNSVGAIFTEVELCRVKFLFQRSALTGGGASNIVPNRNSVFAHIAAGIAVSAGSEMVTMACNKDDQSDFPDCTHEWLDSINASLKAAKINVEVCAPYIGMTKWQIVQRAKEIGAPYLDTMSCYGGNNCRICDACRKREEALK
jgi:7-cyano-7-deazaguanine synthase